MAYKKIERYLSFADIVINQNADKNRSLLFLRQLNKSIDWNSIETLIPKYYPVGKSSEGEKHILPCFCSSACFSKNGSGSVPIPSSKVLSMTGSPLNPF